MRARIFSPQQGKHPFDRVHGVDTGGLLYANALATGHPNDIAGRRSRGRRGVESQALFAPGYLIEIEAVARIPVT